MPPRSRKSSLQIAKEVEEATPEAVTEESEQTQQEETLFDISLLFHTDKGVDRVEIGQMNADGIRGVMSDVSNAFNTLRANTSFLIQDTAGNINFFNLEKVSRIEFSQKVVTK